jgi:hypothetical protein
MITTLRDYRQSYPETAPEPTLTQNRMLGVLLERQHWVAASRARRRARYQAMVATTQGLAARVLLALRSCGLL